MAVPTPRLNEFIKELNALQRKFGLQLHIQEPGLAVIESYGSATDFACQRALITDYTSSVGHRIMQYKRGKLPKWVKP